MTNLEYYLEIKGLPNSDFNDKYEYLKKYKCSAPLILIETEDHVELKNKELPHFGGVYVDFLSGKSQWRKLHGGGNGQPVAKAVFSKKKEKPVVYDATAGLGRDSYVLASLGCKVVMFERNEVVRVLLKDGLRRAYDDSFEGENLREHLILSEKKSILELSDEKQCDVVYIDPMYPQGSFKAQVKKEMFLFHSLVGMDLDANLLFYKAMNIAKERVSVKRPSTAPFLANVKTFNSILTKSHRFDIYLPS